MESWEGGKKEEEGEREVREGEQRVAVRTEEEEEKI